MADGKRMTPNDADPATIWPVLEQVQTFIEQESFRGYDPYDALNSPLLRALSFDRKTLRIAFTQALKRLPVNLRPLLGIPKRRNAKGLGLFLWGYAKRYAMDQAPIHLARVREMAGHLAERRSPGCTGNAWGYPFPWQSRVFYLPAGTPTLVNSAFIGHALLDAHALTGLASAVELAVPIKDFILRDLHRTPDGDAFCFSYTPRDRTVVHNANVLGASLLIRLFGVTGGAELRDAALASLAYTMRRQRPDGSWWYADTPTQQWIDSFHTGFVLESLQRFLEAGFVPEHREAFARGVRFYAENFFLTDGTPKYYHDRVAPLDIHAPAEAVVFFSRQGEACRELAGRVLGWMLANLWDDRGYFRFGRRGPFRVAIPYMRWSQAWAFHALTEYLLRCGAEDHGP